MPSIEIKVNVKEKLLVLARNRIFSSVAVHLTEERRGDDSCILASLAKLKNLAQASDRPKHRIGLLQRFIVDEGTVISGHTIRFLVADVSTIIRGAYCFVINPQWAAHSSNSIDLQLHFIDEPTLTVGWFTALGRSAAIASAPPRLLASGRAAALAANAP
eukprot:gene21748-28769_t